MRSNRPARSIALLVIGGLSLSLAAPSRAQNLPIPQVTQGDTITSAPVRAAIKAVNDAKWDSGDNGASVLRRGGNVGIFMLSGSPLTPSQLLHVADGNILLEGGGETAFQIKRDFSTSGVKLPARTNPIFSLGRINEAGDGDPEIRVLYSDKDLDTTERPVFEFDRKGIVASVKQHRGSHFEGFACIRGEATPTVDTCTGDNPNDENPVFRLNSSPFMQLEMGQGGTTLTDVALRRTGGSTLSLLFGADVRSGTPTGIAGNVGIGTATPTQRLDVAGNVRAFSFIAGNTTLDVPDYVFDNDYHLMPLVDLRAYTMAEHHLPNVPSAADFRRDGVDLGRFQMKLLEKIEELTLYVLTQQETATAQQARIDALETRLRELAAGQR